MNLQSQPQQPQTQSLTCCEKTIKCLALYFQCDQSYQETQIIPYNPKISYLDNFYYSNEQLRNKFEYDKTNPEDRQIVISQSERVKKAFSLQWWIDFLCCTQEQPEQTEFIRQQSELPQNDKSYLGVFPLDEEKSLAKPSPLQSFNDVGYLSKDSIMQKNKKSTMKKKQVIQIVKSNNLKQQQICDIDNIDLDRRENIIIQNKKNNVLKLEQTRIASHEILKNIDKKEIKKNSNQEIKGDHSKKIGMAINIKQDNHIQQIKNQDSKIAKQSIAYYTQPVSQNLDQYNKSNANSIFYDENEDDIIQQNPLNMRKNDIQFNGQDDEIKTPHLQNVYPSNRSDLNKHNHQNKNSQTINIFNNATIDTNDLYPQRAGRIQRSRNNNNIVRNNNLYYQEDKNQMNTINQQNDSNEYSKSYNPIQSNEYQQQNIKSLNPIQSNYLQQQIQKQYNPIQQNYEHIDSHQFHFNQNQSLDNQYNPNNDGIYKQSPKQYQLQINSNQNQYYYQYSNESNHPNQTKINHVINLDQNIYDNSEINKAVIPKKLPKLKKSEDFEQNIENKQIFIFNQQGQKNNNEYQSVDNLKYQQNRINSNKGQSQTHFSVEINQISSSNSQSIFNKVDNQNDEFQEIKYIKKDQDNDIKKRKKTKLMNKVVEIIQTEQILKQEQIIEDLTKKKKKKKMKQVIHANIDQDFSQAFQVRKSDY